ncbi:MAG: FtsX-like permease family protein [Ruminococcus sp.]|nr:FtsX-like permease family protein [Ruminococcus sp.]
MLFKLTLRNIRQSLRDYAIYFFTLIIGVSIFYLFNAIETQTSYLHVTNDTREMIKRLNQILAGTSVFVAVVLGLLIVYASRFLMKRRNREFALYLTLGMGKGGISLLLLVETIVIGIGSLAVGLLIGVGLSQLTSAYVSSLFEADMSTYEFVISGGAIVKTLIYFGIMYLVVMIFNTVMIGRRKLIDLMNAGKRSEKLRAANPAVCAVMFAISAAALALAYYFVGWRTKVLEPKHIIIFIIIGCASTYFLFRSVSGMLLRVFMSSKKLYFKGLNSFTFRQLSSKVGTMVFSLTLICLMLFVTICALCGAFTIRNSMNENLEKCCPADYQLGLSCAFYDEKNDSVYYNKIDVEKLLGDAGIDTDEYFEKYCVVTVYADEKYDTREYFGEYSSQLPEASDMMMGVEMGGVIENTMTLSDFNALMRVFGLPEESLADDEYIELANVNTDIAQRNIPLENGHEITVFGKKLRPKYKECVERTIQLSNVPVNYGVTVIPDGAADPEKAREYYLTAKYNTSDKDRKLEYDNDLLSDEIYNKLWAAIEEHDNGMGIASKQFLNITKMELAQANIGTKALATFLGLYIGVVFLITSGAILALRSLSDCADSLGRYDMLRKIGADERDITGSLFIQTILFFAFPLILALIHSVFGMKFAFYFLRQLGTTSMLPSTLMTGGIVLLIFGGYFVITYITSRLMIRNER